MASQPNQFGEWIRKYCELKKWSNAKFAVRAGISPGAVVSYISGKKGKKTKLHAPRRGTLLLIARKLGLDAGETDALWRSAGQTNDDPTTKAEDIHDQMLKIARDKGIELNAKVRLFRTVENEIALFNAELQKKIHVAVIPIAGWQKQILSPDLTAQLLHHAVLEAVQVKIRTIVVVVAPEQEALLKGTKVYQQFVSTDGVHLHFAIQEQATSGPGHAVLTGAEHCQCISKKEPFVVIFPDEFTKNWCLQSMIEQYRESTNAIVAVQRISKAKPQRRDMHGVAYCEKVKGNRPTEELIQIQKLEEAPDQIKRNGWEAYRVFGRYIVSPKVSEALLIQARTHQNKPLFLTGALNLLAEQRGVRGVLVSDELQSIRSLRVDMEATLKDLREALDKRLAS